MRSAFQRMIPCAATVLALALAACGNSGNNGGGSSPDSAANADNAAKLERPTVKTQAFKHPCDWVPLEEVEKVLGKLTGEPRLGMNAESPRPDEEGQACVYPVADISGSPGEIAVQVDPFGFAAYEQAMGTMSNLFARELADGKPTAPVAREAEQGWDYTHNLPEMSVWRLGHVAIVIGGNIFLMPNEKLEQIAALFRDRITDLPFAQNGVDPNAAGSQPDPCALISRAEAEAVLGKLLLDPYRSSESSALADGDGPSCTYYNAGHRALVITPTWSDGKEMFGMAGGMSGLLRTVTGGADTGDAFDGPWDQATEGGAGSVYFLKGDRMLEVIYKTSTTDASGAAELAQAAVGRL